MKSQRAVHDLRREIRAEAARTDTGGATQVNVVVITTDFTLLSVLKQSGSPEHSFWQTASADAAVDLLVSGRRGILILDLATLGGNLTGLLYRLEMQFPDLVVLATGTREQESAVVSLVGKGRIYRFLHKPVSSARAGLFLGTATRRYLEMRGSQSKAFGSVRDLAGRRPARTLLISVGAVLAALGGTAAFLMSNRSPAPAKPASALVSTQPAPRGPAQAGAMGGSPSATGGAAVDTSDMLSRYLAVAQGAYSDGRLISPPGNNALEYYRSALRLQANNAEALLGVERIQTALEMRVSKALQDGDAAAAAQALDTFQQAQPNAPQLDTLRARVLSLSSPNKQVVSRQTPPPRLPPPTAVPSTPAPAAVKPPAPTLATVATNSPKPAAAASAPKPAATKVASMPNVEQARNRIRNGQLIEPADNSALFFLRQAQSAGEDSTVLRIAATDLGQRLLDGVRSAWAANQAEQAQRLLEAASTLDRQFDLGLPDLDTVTAESKRFSANAVEQARARRLSDATQLREAGQLLEPAGTSAYERVTALAADYPNAEDVRAEKRRLATALVDGGEAALKSGNRRRAQTFAERAVALVPDLDTAAALSQKIASAGQRPQVVSGATLPRVREVAPKYPRAAERDGIEGSVDVEFTIAPDGTTQDLVVRDSTPKKVFDEAALQAVEKWVFKPVIRDGEPVAQRTVLKIQFSLRR